MAAQSQIRITVDLFESVCVRGNRVRKWVRVLIRSRVIVRFKVTIRVTVRVRVKVRVRVRVGVRARIRG